MKKFNTYYHSYLFKCWLVALAYQSGISSSLAASDEKYDEFAKSSSAYVNPSLNQGTGNIKIVKKKSFQNDSLKNIVGVTSNTKTAVGQVSSLHVSSSDELIDDLSHFLANDDKLLAQLTDGEQSSSLLNLNTPFDSNHIPLPVLTPSQYPKESPISQPSTSQIDLAPSASQPSQSIIDRPQGSVDLPDITQPPANPQKINENNPSILTSPRSANSSSAKTSINLETTPQTDIPSNGQSLKEISINFNNVSMIEYIRFISRISNKNFIFDDEDLQFNVTIVSEEPTSVENLMAALLQELRIRDLLLIEQGNNLIIHRNSRVRAPSRIVFSGTEPTTFETEIVTRVFRLNTLDPLKASEIIRPLLSEDALIEVLRDSNNLIITDLVTNVNKIAQLISTLDAPNSGVIVGQYVVRNAFVASLADLATKILQPIAQGNPFVLVPHSSTNSIFIVSNPFIVDKTLAILENLDINEGRTKILDLEKLRIQQEVATRLRYPPETHPGAPDSSAVPEEQGDTSGVGTGGISPKGTPLRAGDTSGTLNIPGAPLNPNFLPGNEGRLGIFKENQEFLPGGISPNSRWAQDLPAGHIERTLFFIYKLRYRKGEQIVMALRRIGESLQMTGLANLDLIASINSSQWIESSNSLIFTGTVPALERIKELILEIDIPLRQVFIEMLILDTTITDSLTYGVDWGSRFGGGNTAGGQNFLGTGSGLVGSLTNAITNNPIVDTVLSGDGYTAGIIGRHLTHGGLHFSTIGALVKAIHSDTKINIIMNPKIVTEDNNTAEVFVGSTDRYKTQSIANDIGSVITNNFQFIDVGTTLRVTPLIGNNGIITLDIIQEVTNDGGNANPSVGNNPSVVDVNLVPVLSKSRTVTKVHVPDGFFVILSGMIQSTESRSVNRIPCLGGLPLIGGISKQKSNRDSKRNLMIFIRPLIVDTEEDLESVTKRQQDVCIEKSKFKRSWNYELDEAMDFLNLKLTDPDETGRTVR
ncbi:hypothetical protein [Candidatus Protochlamydia sp. R18]|uniref:hypothetical protein n=1 Tax=Candidatus Protochlamydia sp. R18 TaxID=1353977 RepID=UPI000693FA9E|nr:hypothetical protein [Candidatus Protochlamydia sp. R18]